MSVGLVGGVAWEWMVLSVEVVGVSVDDINVGGELGGLSTTAIGSGVFSTDWPSLEGGGGRDLLIPPMTLISTVSKATAVALFEPLYK
jgi:hypothetical protein